METEAEFRASAPPDNSRPFPGTWAHSRIAELEAAILAAKVLLEPTSDTTEDVWQILDQAYHQHKT